MIIMTICLMPTGNKDKYDESLFTVLGIGLGVVLGIGLGVGIGYLVRWLVPKDAPVYNNQKHSEGSDN